MALLFFLITGRITYRGFGSLTLVQSPLHVEFVLGLKVGIPPPVGGEFSFPIDYRPLARHGSTQPLPFQRVPCDFFALCPRARLVLV